MVTDYLNGLIEFCPNWGKLDCNRIILFDFREFLDKKSVLGTVCITLQDVKSLSYNSPTCYNVKCDNHEFLIILFEREHCYNGIGEKV